MVNDTGSSLAAESSIPAGGTGSCAKKDTGTTVFVAPDPKYFDSATIPLGELKHLLKSKAVLLPGLVVVLQIEQANGDSLRVNGAIRMD